MSTITCTHPTHVALVTTAGRRTHLCLECAAKMMPLFDYRIEATFPLVGKTSCRVFAVGDEVPEALLEDCTPRYTEEELKAQVIEKMAERMGAGPGDVEIKVGEDNLHYVIVDGAHGRLVTTVHLRPGFGIGHIASIFGVA